MTIRRNIFFSMLIHASVVIIVLTVHGRDAAFRVPSQYIKVSLISEFVLEKPEDFQHHKNDIKRHSVSAIKRADEASAPASETKQKIETPPATQQNENAVSAESANKVSVEEAELKGQSHDSGKKDVFRESADELFIREEPPEMETAGQGLSAVAANAGHAYSYDIALISAIRDAIEKAKHYPLLAKKRGVEGTVTAGFTINADGFPENIKIIRSSGYKILDSEAKKTVLRASPYPAVKGRVEIPITFRLIN